MNVDQMYDQAFEREERTQKYVLERQRFLRMQRDLELELLQDGFMRDADPEIRTTAIRLHANQLLEERQPELFAYLDAEDAFLSAANTRDQALVAAGWAQQFETNAELRGFEGRLREGLGGPKGELEQ